MEENRINLRSINARARKAGYRLEKGYRRDIYDGQFYINDDGQKVIGYQIGNLRCDGLVSGWCEGRYDHSYSLKEAYHELSQLCLLEGVQLPEVIPEKP